MKVVRYLKQPLFHLNWQLVFALIAFIASGLATSATFSAADTAKVNRLLQLISERLDMAPEVARAKWNTKTPIEDPSREERIIDAVLKRAGEYRLDPQVVKAFFIAQMEASKVIQNALHAEWVAKNQPPFTKTADLVKDIRPALNQLTPAMMQALAEALPVLRQPGGHQLLEERIKIILVKAPGGEAAVRAAIAPLLKLSR